MGRVEMGMGIERIPKSFFPSPVNRIDIRVSRGPSQASNHTIPPDIIPELVRPSKRPHGSRQTTLSKSLSPVALTIVPSGKAPHQSGPR